MKMNKKQKRAMWEVIKIVLALSIIVAGIAAAIYYGLWVMFIQSIISACAAFDAGTLTASVVGWTVIKCIFASTVAGIILSAACAIAKFLCK